MRVVPYYGESACELLSPSKYHGCKADTAARKVIREYELYHKGKQGKAEGLKA